MATKHPRAEACDFCDSYTDEYKVVGTEGIVTCSKCLQIQSGNYQCTFCCKRKAGSYFRGRALCAICSHAMGNMLFSEFKTWVADVSTGLL